MSFGDDTAEIVGDVHEHLHKHDGTTPLPRCGQGRTWRSLRRVRRLFRTESQGHAVPGGHRVPDCLPVCHHRLPRRCMPDSRRFVSGTGSACRVALLLGQVEASVSEVASNARTYRSRVRSRPRGSACETYNQRSTRTLQVAGQTSRGTRKESYFAEISTGAGISKTLNNRTRQ